MANEKWTPDQLSAIELKPDKMLVSAAAGSGKTAVLSERIIRRLEDPDADVTKFLIVTYTRAAASELRSRIGKKLRAEAAKDNGGLSKHFSRQCNRLGSANISTIHSYCATLVKRNFNKFDPPLPPVLSVCEEAQAIEIKSRLMDELIEFAYSDKFLPIPDFKAFANNFVTTNDRALADEMLKHYQTVSGLPRGFERWKKAADTLASDTPFLHTQWGKYLIDEYCRKLKFYELVYERIINIVRYDPACTEYEKQITEELNSLRSITAALQKKDILAAVKAVSDITFDRITSVKDKATVLERKEFQDGPRKKLRENVIKKLKAELLFSTQPTPDGGDSPEIRTVREKSADIARGLVALLEEFNRLYSDEKRRLGILDFADLEQYTYKLLYDEKGELTPLAYEVSAAFDEIFVDEFQDINPMQSDIFAALSCRCPIFQVGDIKQSIYGFRGAAPDIFADCRRRYTALDRKDPGTASASELTVFLSANFRSMYPVTAFVNRIFDPLFYTPKDYVSANDRIPYSDGDRLICRRADSYEDEEKTVLKKDLPPVNLTIIEVPQDRKRNGDSEDADSAEEADKNAAAALTADQAECLFVANKIAELMKNGVKGKDIAIVARAAGHVALIEEYLLKKGITASNDKGAPLADMPEIQLALSILSCVDNPHKDIALAGALRSPVFGFTLDELITVRRYKSGVSLFSALRDYTEKEDMKKGRRFIEFLDRMRACTAGRTASHVLWQIYVETDFFSLVYDGGKASRTLAASRRANLLKLHSLASQSDNVGRDGIYTFLRRFEYMAKQKDPPTASSVKDENTVRFFTTHGSKGLEFPHCFVCGLGHSTQKSQQRDLSSDVMCDNDLGVAVKLRDKTSIIKTDTPIRKALSDRKKFMQFEEALRVLYVALTRAKDNLYVTAAVPDYDALMNAAKTVGGLDHPAALYTLTEPVEWIMAALYTERNGSVFLSPDELRIEKVTEEEIRASIGAKSPGNGGNAGNKKSISPDREIYDRILSRLTTPYPHEISATLPAKISVSRLKPSLLNDEEEEQNELSEATNGAEIEENGDFVSPDADVKPVKTSSSLKTPLFALGARRTGIRDKIAEENAEAELKNALKYNNLSGDLGELAKNVSAAEKGTATHLFMQFCDFENTEKNGVEAEIERLVSEQFILPYHAAIIDPEAVKRFMTSASYKEMAGSVHLRREVRFNTHLPAEKFTTDPDKKKALTGELLLVQGVIDCYYVTADGKNVLLDYKTDSFEEGVSEAEIEDTLRKRHSRQLSYYKLALERLLLRKIDRVEIFSFALGRTVCLWRKK